MKILVTLLSVATCLFATAQQYPNNEFKTWDKASGCPASWYCNNDADCKGKITMADKLKGGAKLTVMHCFDPSKEDRSNNVNMNLDELKLKVQKGKKVKVILDYSYMPVAGDIAYIKADVNTSDDPLDYYPSFIYNGSITGELKQGNNQQIICYVNFGSEDNRNFISPTNFTEFSVNTTFGIMAAAGLNDVHKGTNLIIHRVKVEME